MKDTRLMVYAEFCVEGGGTRWHQCTELVRPEHLPAEEKRLRDAGAINVRTIGRANITTEAWARAAALTKLRGTHEQLELVPRKEDPQHMLLHPPGPGRR